MAGLLGGGGEGRGGLLSGITNTLNSTTKGLPIVRGITEPLLDSVDSGGAPDGGKKPAQAQQPQATAQGQDLEAAALAKKKKLHEMKKRQLALEMEEMEMDGK
ncbi:uncharacterized protein PV06_01510 [Exophiala oligosperma]|uniref:Uncharacterized protein n=1 Tax=Exophiala oligosperma TaxID=215243 RepID=A0A0D2EM60_9EURO|nr:uncharacterized protein PV06_01510 [Exophiala oligosperma]KIW48954.1 hypothetical protein PV06_01510 [Exophiala oligosperma]